MKLFSIVFCLSLSCLYAHEDPHDVIHALTHSLEHAEKADEAELYFKRAIEYRASGQKQKAKVDLEKYTELKPTDHLGWLELGRLETDSKVRLNCLKTSCRLAKLDEEKSLSYYAIAEHFYETKDYQTALGNCEKSIELDSQNKLTPTLLKSHLLWRLRRLDDRVDFLTVSKESNPSIVLRNEVAPENGANELLVDLLV